MKRTNTNGLKVFEGSEALQTFASTLVARNKLAAKIGMEMYEGRRDLYKALGYPITLTFQDYLSRYTRQDIAAAIIDRPVTATWQGALELIESDDAEETDFELAWRNLNYDLRLKGVLERVDRLTGLGRYGVLLLGLDDVNSPEDFSKPVSKGNRKLIYIKPFSEETAKIDTYEDNPKNARYGYPKMYGINVSDVSGASVYVQVHYTRIIHIVDNSLESEIIGTPRLEAVFNRLYDIEKVVGGSAEMFWRGARPGYKGTVDKDYAMTSEAKDALMDQLEEYENDLRRFLVAEGIEVSGMDTQVSDPKGHLDVQLTLLSAQTGIPKRILSGSERGELSSAQDSGEWKTYVKARRENQAEPQIVRPLVDRLITLGVLPKPAGEYHIDWEDLFATSEAQRVALGKDRATALREYSYNPIEAMIVPPDGFLEYFLGFDRKQIEYMKQLNTNDILSELASVQEIMAPPAATTVEKTPVRTKKSNNKNKST